MENNENQTRKSKTKNSTNPKTEKEEGLKKRPIWKWLFIILLALNIAGVVFIAIRVTSPRDQTVLNQNSTNRSDQKVAQITSTTSQLNELINSYLETYQTKEMTYKFYISNQQAVLEASYKLFGTKIPLYIYFEPLALSDGSISLSVQNISAGSLSLPTSEVLQIVKAYDLPDFVQVESKKNQVVINLSKINVSGNLYIKANQIDLAKGNFVFDFMKKA
ncbi:MAG: YpmS family protein [Lactococcus lactis]|mgnify:FL=1|nr:YpmS family protein [Lactococcus lactis]